MADPEPALMPVLRQDVRLDRTFYLLLHEDNRNLARVRLTAKYISDEVARNKKLFNPAK